MTQIFSEMVTVNLNLNLRKIKKGKRGKYNLYNFKGEIVIVLLYHKKVYI